MAVALTMVAAGACGARAQDADTVAVVAKSTAEPNTNDSLLVLVPIRSIEAIRTEIDEYKAQALAAEGAESSARLLESRAATAITVKKAERKAMQVNLDLADAQKDETAKSEWRGRIRLADLETRLLQERASVRKSEIAAARAQHAYAEAHIEALVAELDLQGRRAQRNTFAEREATPEVAAGLLRLDLEIEALEKRTLELQAKSAERWSDVAGKAAEVAKKRLKVLAAQTTVMRGR